MKFGFVFPKNDPAAAVEAAAEAELAGWDAFLTWEAPWGMDPWVTLGAAASRTEHIRLGTLLTPLAIRQPWKLASETATLDALSGGRVILSVGLGAIDTGFADFGLPTDKKHRAELVDEGLEILEGLWQSKPFPYRGKHFRIKEQSFITAPPPVQQRGGRPHIPIWMVGAWNRPKSMQRVLRCDGFLPNVLSADGKHQAVTPAIVAEMSGWFAENAPEGHAIDIVVEGTTPGDDVHRQQAAVRPFADAGAAWWIEAMWQAEDFDSLLRRIRHGPPRLEA